MLIKLKVKVIFSDESTCNEYYSFNPFSTNFPLLYPLKTSKKFWFSDVFRGYRSGKLVENGLISVKC